MCSDYMKYVGKRNSKAVDAIGKKIKGEARNKKEYYYAVLKDGYYFACTDENLPMNERGEIYSDNFVKFKEMLRSITLLESIAKAEKKAKEAAKRLEKKMQKKAEEEDSFKLPSKKLRITEKDKKGLSAKETVGIITGRFGTEKVIFTGEEIEVDVNE